MTKEKTAVELPEEELPAAERTAVEYPTPNGVVVIARDCVYGGKYSKGGGGQYGRRQRL